MKIIVSTRNPSKAVQIEALLQGLPVTILSLDDAGIVGEAIEDDATLEVTATSRRGQAFRQVRDFLYTL